MRILLVGNGGREHAIAWKLSTSAHKPALFIAPGNPGTAELGENVDIDASDIDGLLAFARRERIDLTVVGPEQPLVMGIVDAFEEAGQCIFGPSQGAARLEGSKSFAKAFMQRYGIPTAAHRTFGASQYDAARAYIRQVDTPVVLKASGLAAGKGVLICETRADAGDALRQMMLEQRFGAAGDEVVVEEYMEGEEASIFAITDGEGYVLLSSAQDHKRVGEGDTGPNTGGMGAYAPAPVVTLALEDRVRREIVEPTLAGMRAEGTPYRGVLYGGLMIRDGVPRVVEFNCRFGDPETQVVLPMLASDLLDLILTATEGGLAGMAPTLHFGAAACVVMASGGYPGAYAKDKPIEGLEAARSAVGTVVFHAGTRRDDDGRIVTAGGRVLAVTGLGDSLAAALDRAYTAVSSIHFEGAYYRKDIGKKGLARLV